MVGAERESERENNIPFSRAPAKSGGEKSEAEFFENKGPTKLMLRRANTFTDTQSELIEHTKSRML